MRIILVRPQMGENIGATARVMKNFGLADLRIVAPRDGWPNPKAVEMARRAEEILEAATITATLAEATADLEHSIAITGRSHAIAKPVMTAREGVAYLAPHALAGQKIGLIFGPERTGLESRDIDHADWLITIPTSPDHSSLNLAQAVAIMAYEWRSQISALPLREHGFTPHTPAPKQAMEAMLDRLFPLLEAGQFFREETLKPQMLRNIRTMLQRGQWSDQELRTFHGIVTALVKSAAHDTPSSHSPDPSEG